MGWWRRKKSEEANKKQRLVQENGKVLLEKLIESCDGKSNPIKTFSASQILRATNNFSQNNSLVRHASTYQCYRGMLEDRLVLVKKRVTNYSPSSDKICRDIAISSMVSGHKNFLKLLGCCLEFFYPVLVYEYAESILCRPKDGPRFLFDVNLQWYMRSKISKEIAEALTYLHTAFSKSMIIHKDMIPCKIFLDDKGTAKLSEFENSVLIPEGENFVDDIVEGTVGYLDHNYMYTGRVTENTDVYGFGAFMLTLLTAMQPSLIDQLYKDSSPIEFVEDGRFVEIIDPMVLESCKEQEKWKLKAFFILSLRCIGCIGEVPKIIEVSKDLKRLLF